VTPTDASMVKIKSDPTLLAEVRQYGDFDTNACFQCGSCTIVCNLTNGTASFPRRIVRYALMGLRKPLLSSLEPWLCYYCGDCSTTCPRQTEPGEAMMTLRRYLTAQYDWTGLASRIYRSRAWEIGALVSVGVLVLLLALFYHLSIVGMELGDLTEPMGMEHMFDLIETFTRSVFLLSAFFLLTNAGRMYWLTMRRGNRFKIPFLLYLTEAKTFIVQAITQIRYRECTDNSRWIKHLFLVAGCALLFVLKIFFLSWFQTDEIYPIYHPQRWLGYFAAGALIYVTADILIGRIKKREQIHKFSDSSDWILPVLLLLTALSGLAVHVLRYLEFSLTAHYVYALHLAIAVPMLVIEIPFGKWAHMMYRPLASYFQSVRDQAMQQHLLEEAILDHVD